MPEYSALAILFICMHLISLCLLSTLVYVILKSGSYITKWTIFQLCICLLILSLSSLLTIIIYGNSLQEKALDSTLCIVQNKIITFIYCPIKMLPVALYIYLWFAVTRVNYNLEQNYFWYISGLIWVITITASIMRLMNNIKEKNWGAQPSVLFCKSAPSSQTWLHYIVPTSILAIIFIIATVHSSYMLWDRWRNFNQKQNRRTAIDLGYAVRLTILSSVYSVMLLISLIPAIINHSTKSNVEYTFVDFAPSFAGIIFFMVFGTTKSAAIFLPCCYYLPPNDKRTMINRSFSNVENSSMRVELDMIVRSESPKDDATIETVSTRISIPEEQ